MDHFVARERVTALVTMCKACVLSLPRTLSLAHFLRLLRSRASLMIHMNIQLTRSCAPLPYRYAQGLPLSLVTSQLSFDSPQEAHDFLSGHNAALYKDAPPATQLTDRVLDAKRASAPLADVLGKFQVSDLKGQI